MKSQLGLINWVCFLARNLSDVKFKLATIMLRT